MLFNNNAVILNGVYWLFATKFVFSSILMFKTCHGIDSAVANKLDC